MTSSSARACDVHQHLWPPALLEALRARTEPPFLRGYTLYLDGEPPYEVNPADHDVAARLAQQGDVRALVSLSSPLGLEDLPPAEAQPLLDAWHTGAQAFPAGFGAWAAVGRIEPDRAGLAELLRGSFVGLQIPATWISTPRALEALAPVLQVCEGANKPVFVHPGAVSSPAEEELPGWWPAVVDYTAQMSAAWWAWHRIGRSLLPQLRIGFVAGAGLAPLHHERMVARGGRLGRTDPGVFVETSSYGPQAVDALIRALGIDAVIRGSDRPYAQPTPLGFGNAADHAIDVSNPQRFLIGGTP
ncbi:amidohydrolase family protein [Kineosporia babensis]|uniref:Amidohydrolase n=1 Tax=Kineosporia babensis TaxID=499548 RepID=A0A9X1NCW4_9ACTN|nr:amidohydrolase [Kineosporia babensis]